MGVSVTASRGLSGSTIKNTSVAVIAVFVVLFYLYGPPATPAVQDAAIARCNDHASGDYRSFRLSWEVGVRPHWTCWDARRPQEQPVSFGWWVNPFR
jgi:hypothetical protein